MLELIVLKLLVWKSVEPFNRSEILILGKSCSVSYWINNKNGLISPCFILFSYKKANASIESYNILKISKELKNYFDLVLLCISFFNEFSKCS